MFFHQTMDRPLEEIRRETENSVRRHRFWYSVEAVAFMALGLVALVIPYATAYGVNLVIGAVLIVSGLFQLITLFKTDHRIAWGFSALLSLVIGSLLIGFPVAGTVAVATLIAAFLFIEGVLEVSTAVSFRHSAGWGWLLVSGILSIGLALLVMVGWPSATILFLGILVGINLLFYGISLLMLTVAVGKT